MAGGDGNLTEENPSDAEDSSNSANNTDESGSSSDEEVQVELMVNARARRSTAGNKMKELIQSTSQEDDFYKSAYGGGKSLKDDADDVFESPVHSDVDEVDSDFDKPEEEDEPISDDENEEKRGRRKGKGYKEPSRGLRPETATKNKAWAMTRMAGKVVAANSVDAKTQAARLKEAEQTEKANIESLRKLVCLFIFSLRLPVIILSVSMMRRFCPWFIQSIRFRLVFFL
ncbi:unnamed protein product [Nippostrongylus brasiliensis]|uniref:YL1 domain-containing protein n=1 Tax=Nippostrongylus brasiliensis TaxID=27835 RepID=A0A0N4XHM8_NIPBR|nr:unnamed protein product [Nippostrongylus brasiliensis]